MEVQFFKSRLGKPVALFRGYKYYRGRFNPKTNTTYWFCSAGECSAGIWTDNNDANYAVVRFTPHMSPHTTSFGIPENVTFYVAPYSFLSKNGGKTIHSTSKSPPHDSEIVSKRETILKDKRVRKKSKVQKGQCKNAFDFLREIAVSSEEKSNVSKVIIFICLILC